MENGSDTEWQLADDGMAWTCRRSARCKDLVDRQLGSCGTGFFRKFQLKNAIFVSGFRFCFVNILCQCKTSALYAVISFAADGFAFFFFILFFFDFEFDGNEIAFDSYLDILFGTPGASALTR